MSKGEYKDFATKAVHSGQHYDESTGAHIAPMHLTSTYIFTPEKMGLRADTLLAAAGDSSMIVWHVRAERDGREFLRSCPAVLRLH